MKTSQRSSRESDRHHFYSSWAWKIVMVGNAGVGKTNIVSSFLHNTFDVNKQPTTNVLYEETAVKIGRLTFKINIWDTAGQERYRALVRTYYRNANGVLLVYDVTNRKSFEDCTLWLKDMASANGVDSNLLVMFVGNKIDLDESSNNIEKIDSSSSRTTRAVTMEEALSFARENHLYYIETSAKTGFNVQNAFKTMIKELATIFWSVKSCDLDDDTNNNNNNNNKEEDDLFDVSGVITLKEYNERKRMKRKKGNIKMTHSQEKKDKKEEEDISYDREHLPATMGSFQLDTIHVSTQDILTRNNEVLKEGKQDQQQEYKGYIQNVSMEENNGNGGGGGSGGGCC